MAAQAEDVWEMMHPRLLRTEARIYREPRGAPEIGRRPLDLGIMHRPKHQEPTQMPMPHPPHLEVPLYDEYYGARPRMLRWQGNPV